LAHVQKKGETLGCWQLRANVRRAHLGGDMLEQAQTEGVKEIKRDVR